MPAAQQQTITLTFGDIEHGLPAKFVLCDRCKGRGTHVNPAVDGNGLTREDFDEDPDFKESYFAGHYDVTCERCNGLRVVAVLDEERCTAQVLKAYYKHLEEEARYNAECASERRWEYYASGGR